MSRASANLDSRLVRVFPWDGQAGSASLRQWAVV